MQFSWGNWASNHSSLPCWEHGKGGGKCQGSGKILITQITLQSRALRKRLRGSPDTSKLYLQLTPVTLIITVPRGGNLPAPASGYQNTGPHPRERGKAPGKVLVMDPSPAGSCPGGAVPRWSHQELPCPGLAPTPPAQSPSRGSGQGQGFAVI